MINDDALSQSLVFIVDADAADHEAPKKSHVYCYVLENILQ